MRPRDSSRRGSIAYGDGETFDLVASGATGADYVDGVPLATKLRP